MTDTIKHTRIFKLWRDRVLNDEEWEHGKIRQWCKAVHGLAYEGVASGHATNLDTIEADLLIEMFETRWPGEFDGPRVTEAQAQLGRHWLATKGKRFGVFDVGHGHTHEAADITHFTFVGGMTLQGGAWPYITPIYVAFWPDGVVLRYWATPWQDHADMEWKWGHA